MQIEIGTVILQNEKQTFKPNNISNQDNRKANKIIINEIYASLHLSCQPVLLCYTFCVCGS